MSQRQVPPERTLRGEVRRIVTVAEEKLVELEAEDSEREETYAETAREAVASWRDSVLAPEFLARLPTVDAVLVKRELAITAKAVSRMPLHPTFKGPVEELLNDEYVSNRSRGMLQNDFKRRIKDIVKLALGRIDTALADAEAEIRQFAA
ncbi:hypothetical protein JCM10908_006613 [Rhodotorula pacifica]|uniref:uncharacterized protein n=1 Tax=Rhodotorula pacifica TaxID=1495444 RepID=UPI00316E4DC3